jgi:hypothetical protein
MQVYHEFAGEQNLRQLFKKTRNNELHLYGHFLQEIYLDREYFNLHKQQDLGQ